MATKKRLLSPTGLDGNSLTLTNVATPSASSDASTKGYVDTLVPSQTGNTGKYLTTNGTATSWGTIAGGGSVTSITAGTGLTVSVGTNPITTSGTITIDSTVATLTGTQTLTNKTLTSPTFTAPVLGTPASGTLTNCTFPTLNQNTTGSAGSVANTLTISSPLSGTSYNGSSAVSIGIPVATTSTNGYLSSTDWTTFNNKTSNTGTVTSVSGAGTVSGLTLTGTVTGSGSITLGGTIATLNQNTTGSAGSVPASGITGSTLASGVTASSLTSVGTLGTLTVSGISTVSAQPRTAFSNWKDHNINNYLDAAIISRDNTEDSWIFLDKASAQWGIYQRQIDSDLVNAGQPTLPANSLGYIGGNNLNAYLCLGDGRTFAKGGFLTPDTTLVGLKNLSGTSWIYPDDTSGNMWIHNEPSAGGMYFDSDNYYIRYRGTNVVTIDSGGMSITGTLGVSGAITQAGNQVLHAGNYSSYAVARGGDTVDGIFYFRSNKGNNVYLSNTNNMQLQAYSSDGGTAAMSFHRAGQYAVNFGLDPDNVLRLGGWSAPANVMQVNMSGDLTMLRYIFATDFNQSGGNSSNPTIGQIWTQNTSDNYCRKSTPAHFKSQMGMYHNNGSSTSNIITISSSTATGGSNGDIWLKY